MNQDQIQAVERKPEVQSAIKELEDLLAVFPGIEMQELMKHDEELKQVRDEWQDRMNRAVGRIKNERDERESEESRVRYVLHCLLPRYRAKGYIISGFNSDSDLDHAEEENRAMEALGYLKDIFTGQDSGAHT